MTNLTGRLTMISAALALAAAAWAQAGPLGDLEIRGDVRLTQADSGESLVFSDTVFAAFAGDRVATGDSPASLILGSGATFAIGPHSEVSLKAVGEVVEAELVRGWLVYSMGTSENRLRVNGRDHSPTDRLGLLKLNPPTNMAWRQGADAEPLAANAGLNISNGSILLPCSDSNGCDRQRPRSISQ